MNDPIFLIANLLGFLLELFVYNVRGLAAKIMLRALGLGGKSQRSEESQEHGQQESASFHNNLLKMMGSSVMVKQPVMMHAE